MRSSEGAGGATEVSAEWIESSLREGRRRAVQQSRAVRCLKSSVGSTGHDRRFADGAEVRRAEPVGCSHIRLLPTNPPGDWNGVQPTSLRRDKWLRRRRRPRKRAARRRSKGSVGPTKKPALCAGFFVSIAFLLERHVPAAAICLRGPHIGRRINRLLRYCMDVGREPRRRGNAPPARDDDANRFLLLRFLNLSSHDDAPAFSR